MPWEKGKSGNPNGRSAAMAGMAKAMARRIAAETGDGEELVDAMLKLMRDPEAKLADRTAAVFWLAERGAGKAPAQVDVGVTVESATDVLPGNWEQMSPRERERWLDAAFPAPLALVSGEEV
jgi:hypothetical protein